MNKINIMRILFFVNLVAALALPLAPLPFRFLALVPPYIAAYFIVFFCEEDVKILPIKVNIRIILFLFSLFMPCIAFILVAMTSIYTRSDGGELVLCIFAIPLSCYFFIIKTDDSLQEKIESLENFIFQNEERNIYFRTIYLIAIISFIFFIISILFILTHRLDDIYITNNYQHKTGIITEYGEYPQEGGYFFVRIQENNNTSSTYATKIPLRNNLINKKVLYFIDKNYKYTDNSISGKIISFQYEDKSVMEPRIHRYSKPFEDDTFIRFLLYSFTLSGFLLGIYTIYKLFFAARPKSCP